VSPPPPPLPAGPARPFFDAAGLPLRGSLRAYARRFSRSESEIDDLLQDTLLRAYRYWPSFREGSNCRAWLQRILTTTYLNSYRRGRREREVLGELHAVQPLFGPPSWSDPAERGLGDELQRPFGALSREFQVVVWAVDVDGQSYAEAAAALGWPIGTVMSRLHRARQRLASSLPARTAPLPPSRLTGPRTRTLDGPNPGRSEPGTGALADAV
jgi:RNA polymerase sigma-70 factor (ECF subfamily)